MVFHLHPFGRKNNNFSREIIEGDWVKIDFCNMVLAVGTRIVVNISSQTRIDAKLRKTIILVVKISESEHGGDITIE